MHPNWKNLKYLWRVIFTPSCWSQNEKYNPEWSRTLNDLLDREKFKVRISFGTIFSGRLGDRDVWLVNFPYVCFTDYTQGRSGGHPGRLTIFRAEEHLRRDLSRKEFQSLKNSGKRSFRV